MDVKVLGTRKLNFKSDKGDVVSGTQIFVCYQYDGVDGYLTDKIFIRSDSNVKLPIFEYGSEYQFVYSGIGRRQFLTDIIKVNK